MKVRWAWVAIVTGTLALGARADEKPAAAPKPGAAAAKAEAAPRAQRARVNRVVQVKNRDLLDAFHKIVAQFGINVTTSLDLGVIVLSGDADAVAAAEDAIHRFDRPSAGASTPRNLTFTAHLLVGRQQAVSSAPLPAELTPVVEQFRSVFAYKGYELLDTLALRVSDDRRGDSMVEGLARWPAGAALPAKTHLGIQQARITGEDDKGRTVRIARLTVRVHLPIAGTDGPQGAIAKDAITYRTTAVETGLDIREGQKVVVGKASFDGTNDALILVLKVDIEG
jgi:hypothetical protein